MRQSIVCLLLVLAVVMPGCMAVRRRGGAFMKQKVFLQTAVADEWSAADYLAYDVSTLTCGSQEEVEWDTSLVNRCNDLVDHVRKIETNAEQAEVVISNLNRAILQLTKAKEGLEKVVAAAAANTSSNHVFLQVQKNHENVKGLLAKIDTALFPHILVEINKALEPSNSADLEEVIAKLAKAIELVKELRDGFSSLRQLGSSAELQTKCLAIQDQFIKCQAP